MRPACRRMLLSVPGCKSALSLPGTVTRPVLTICLNWRWLPFVAARVHPSPSRRRMISLTVVGIGSRAPRRPPARVALQARAVAHHGEVAAFGAGFADIAFHPRFGALLGDRIGGGGGRRLEGGGGAVGRLALERGRALDEARARPEPPRGPERRARPLPRSSPASACRRAASAGGPWRRRRPPARRAARRPRPGRAPCPDRRRRQAPSRRSRRARYGRGRCGRDRRWRARGRCSRGSRSRS